MKTFTSLIPQQDLTPIKNPTPSILQTQYPFWFGGSAASMAAIITHPLDLVKVRLQLRSPNVPKSMFRMFPHILSHEGVHGLYSGLTAALMRQMTYSTVRFGVYEDLKYRFSPLPTVSDPTAALSILDLTVLSSLSGFVGGVVGNPADVLNVRMQSDGGKAIELRYNYRNAANGLIQMVGKEGFSGLFRGVVPNASRASLMSASQLASYDVFKALYMKQFNLSDGFRTSFAASISAGLVATTVCSPIDVIKTRVMNNSKTQLVEMLRGIVKVDGWMWIFRGWVPSFMRLGPQTTFTMMFFEQHKRIYRECISLE